MGSEQLPCIRVTAFARTSLFLERYWRELRIFLKSLKPVSKTYGPKNYIPFLISNAFIDVADIPLSWETVP